MSPEKKVYFRVQKAYELCPEDRSFVYEWYAIDGNNSSEVEEEKNVESEECLNESPPTIDLNPEEESLKPVFESPANWSYYVSAYVAWKSFIYVFGGRDDDWIGDEISPVSNVCYIDTLHPQLGWKRGPDLLDPRHNPYGVVLDDGKICALGGSQEVCNYGESLVPQPLSGQKNCWLPIMSMNPINRYEDAPVEIDGHAIFSNKLFVYGIPTPSLHCYDFNDKKWSVIEKDFNWKYHCAQINEIMYLVEGSRVRGFDLKSHQWYKVVGFDKETMLPPFTCGKNSWGLPSSLVHLGNGTLCLLWSPYGYIHCTKFTVTKQYDAARGRIIIKANIKSFKVYKINEGFLEYAIVVDAEEDKEKLLKKKKNKKSHRKTGTQRECL